MVHCESVAWHELVQHSTNYYIVAMFLSALYNSIWFEQKLLRSNDFNTSSGMALIELLQLTWQNIVFQHCEQKSTQQSTKKAKQVLLKHRLLSWNFFINAVMRLSFNLSTFLNKLWLNKSYIQGLCCFVIDQLFPPEIRFIVPLYKNHKQSFRLKWVPNDCFYWTSLTSCDARQ